ncbi:hypothetical protein JGH11_19370 [Dysgonomonas sp. Marseille-P4677]|uniref:hypothetical protein n=1 Tax=Dysgonomonas sp. Marseille-P4677 TaxID=2364790 RepID=UPI0019148958|nr:hypothetical protein [Dysgonomonas sp. Marseille-P4677]MBK5723033.1 hypothetical protein [Dysgonomonas sp. Marseille-P4677]
MNQKIEIPEGCNAMIDYENRLVIIEPKEKKQEFKKGDIFYETFVGGRLVGIFNKKEGLDEYSFIARLFINTDRLYIYDIGTIENNARLATPSEQQILFDALAKEGKYWDAEALEVKDFIKVPESVGIYKTVSDVQQNKYGDNLCIAFNNDRQFLGYDSEEGVYIVSHKRNCLEKVQCYLQPCKREDLKAGDTVGIIGNNHSLNSMIDNIAFYNKVLSDSSFVSIVSKTDIEVYDETIHPNLDEHNFYKLIPIK